MSVNILLGFLLLVIWVFLILYNYRRVEIYLLHSLYAVGTAPEKRQKVASRMLELALKEKNPKLQLKQLHWALDVVLCEGNFETLEVGSDLHKKYWEVGHKIAIAIKRHQDNLNIPQIWFVESYMAVQHLMQ